MPAVPQPIEQQREHGKRRNERESVHREPSSRESCRRCSIRVNGLFCIRSVDRRPTISSATAERTLNLGPTIAAKLAARGAPIKADSPPAVRIGATRRALSLVSKRACSRGRRDANNHVESATHHLLLSNASPCY